LSFSQKDALTPLAPSIPPSLLPLCKRQLPLPASSHPAKGWPSLRSTPLPPLLPLRRQRLPLPTDSHPAKGRPPLRPAPLPLLAVGLAICDSPLRAPYSRPPLRASRCKQVCPRAATAPASSIGLPCGLALAVAGRPLVGGLGHSLAVGGRPCMGVGRGWPPLLAAFATKNAARTRRTILCDLISLHVV
ncbi:hypothetical protein BHE74_00021653, partial [Ensete ventricosum]